MNIKDFEYFYSLTQLQSYTAVANKFDISQPSVSYAVKRLEEEFNCKLIAADPSHRTFSLTEQGEILLSHLKRILPELSSAHKEINRSLAHYSTVGFPPMIMNYLLSFIPENDDKAALFQKIRPIRGGSVELLRLLENGDLDASFVATLGPLSHNGLNLQRLFSSEVFVVMSKSHPLANKEILSFSELIDESFIVLDQHFIHLKAFRDLNQKHHNKAEIFFQTDDVDLLKQMLRKNIGISLLADFAFPNDEEKLVKIPLSKGDKIIFYVYLASLKSTILNEDVLNFFDYTTNLLDEK